MKAVATTAALALLLLLAPVHARAPEDARVAAALSTATALSIITATTTVPLICQIGTAANICRRKSFGRRLVLPRMPDTREERSLDSSLGDAAVEETADRDPRISLTIWSTLFGTFTLTSTSTNSATTLSVSYFCTLPGRDIVPACG